MKKFLKENGAEILFGLFFILAICMLVFPSFYELTLKLKDANGDSYKEYYDFTFITVCFGLTSTIYTFSNNIVLEVTLGLLLLSVILYYIGKGLIKNHKKAALVLYYISFVFIFISSISFLFSYYYIPYLDSGLTSINGYHGLSNIGYSFGIFMASMVIMCLFVLRRVFENTKYTIYEISEIAILCALALVLDKVKIPVGATGGSINASAIPLFIISIRYGPLKGIIASSVVFGLISCLFDGYGFQYYPFDYFIAFSGYASVGLFYRLFMKKNKEKADEREFAILMFSIILGSFVSFFTRMIGHTISSMVFYEYTLEAAIIYNLAYVPLSVFGSGIITLFLAKPIQVINHKYPVKVKAPKEANN